MSTVLLRDCQLFRNALSRRLAWDPLVVVSPRLDLSCLYLIYTGKNSEIYTMEFAIA